MKHLFDLIKATAVVCGCCMMIQTIANAQSSRNRKDDAPSARELEERVLKAEAALIKEFKEVADEFYSQGEKEKAIKMLKRLKELDPKLKGLGDHIDSIGEELLQENLEDFEIDTRGVEWKQVGAVFGDKAFRIQSAGEYKMTYTAMVPVDGLKPDTETKDYIPGAPLGCLLGVIVTDGKPGKPFPVRSQLQHTPKEDGLLFLKVNVPQGTRCSGKLKVKVSGYIKTSIK